MPGEVFAKISMASAEGKGQKIEGAPVRAIRKMTRHCFIFSEKRADQIC